MAVRGAPIGGKIGRATRAGKTSAGRLARAVTGRGRQVGAPRGGNPRATELDALVNGRRAHGKLPGAD